jgi:ribosomal protein S15P/S13E
VSERDREEYAEAIARDEIRADKYPATMDRADRVEDETSYFTHNLAVIDGELWEECGEPTYEYYSSWFGRDRACAILVTTDNHRIGRSSYGATDHAALAYYHAGVERRGYIRVLRPDLVTVNRISQELEESAARAARNLDKAREDLKELQEQIKNARAHLAETKKADENARANLAAYNADPRAWWTKKAEEAEKDAAKDGPFHASRARRAASIRRELAKEA